jgi:hypothetical protein
MNPTFLAIGAGAISGLLVVAALSGSSIAVAYLTLVLTMPLFMVGLSQGIRAAAIAVASGTMVAMLFSPEAGFMFAILFGAPSWLLIRLALTGPYGPVNVPPAHPGPYRQEGPETTSTVQDRFLGRVADWNGKPGEFPRDLGWFPAGHILAAMAAIACGQIVAVAFLTGGLETAVLDYLGALADAIAAPQGQKVLHEAIVKAAPFFAGTVAAFWALTLLVNAVLAQGLLAKGGRNLRPSPRLRELRLPDWLSWALVTAALMALIASGEIEYIGRNLFLVLAVPFFFLGLSAVHMLVGMTPLPGALLALVYLLVIFSGWFALLIAGIGILEQWIGVSDRMKPPTS